MKNTKKRKKSSTISIGIARQMGIRENKVYKHKKNALLALAERMKPDEL